MIKKTILTLVLLTSLAQASNGATEPDTTNTQDSNVQFNMIEKLVPSQDKLFKGSKKLDVSRDQQITEDEQVFSLAQGDLEKDLIPRILQIIFFLSATGFTILFMYAGIMLIIKQDEEEELTKVKKLFVNSLIGAVIISVSYAVVTGIISYIDFIR